MNTLKIACYKMSLFSSVLERNYPLASQTGKHLGFSQLTYRNLYSAHVIV